MAIFIILDCRVLKGTSMTQVCQWGTRCEKSLRLFVGCSSMFSFPFSPFSSSPCAIQGPWISYDVPSLFFLLSSPCEFMAPRVTSVSSLSKPLLSFNHLSILRLSWWNILRLFWWNMRAAVPLVWSRLRNQKVLFVGGSSMFPFPLPPFSFSPYVIHGLMSYDFPWYGLSFWVSSISNFLF